jgi:hypothetical protein
MPSVELPGTLHTVLPRAPGKVLSKALALATRASARVAECGSEGAPLGPSPKGKYCLERRNGDLIQVVDRWLMVRCRLASFVPTLATLIDGIISNERCIAARATKTPSKIHPEKYPETLLFSNIQSKKTRWEEKLSRSP